jgi:hypothetical protein
MGPIYNYIELLAKFVIGVIHLKLFKKCWVEEIECLLGTVIKKL